jgi:beta-aspartyl-peptidase (threonine type)
MEACIADGRTGQAGSATLIHRVRNPIRLAREVLVNSPHFFLGGDAAEKFAAKQGLPLMDPHYFWTPLRWRQHVEVRDQEVNRIHDPTMLSLDHPNIIDDIQMNSEDEDDFVIVNLDNKDDANYEAAPQGTVGAVALDAFGNIAAATSTGGRNNKWDGRIGDTPILGAGSYAPIGNTCGVSGTGNGEVSEMDYNYDKQNCLL